MGISLMHQSFPHGLKYYIINKWLRTTRTGFLAIENSMPKLRGHHLVCLHFFRGEGYSQEFVENLQRVVMSARDRGIEVHYGADDVCAQCPYLNHARCQYGEDADKGIGEMDRMALDLLKLSRGMKVGWAEVGEKIPEIFPAWHRAFCTTCSWRQACEGNDLYRKLSRTRTRPHRKRGRTG
jgi:hypothetical protein